MGCATIADLRDPAPTTEASPTTTGDASASPLPTSPTSAPPAIPDASIPDAYTGDGATTTKPPDVTPPTCLNAGKAPNGDSCGQPSDCCSGACTQTKVCDSKCFKIGEGRCDPGTVGQCCIRTYCSWQLNIPSPSHRCKACIEKGLDPEKVYAILLGRDVPVLESCCSGQVDAAGKCK